MAVRSPRTMDQGRCGVAARRGHSFTSEGSPYVSLTSMPHIASEYSNYGVVMRIAVPKSAVLKGLNVHQAEYLVPGGTKVISAVQSQLPLPGSGTTARWIGETGVVVGGSAYGGWELGTYLAGDQDDDR